MSAVLDEEHYLSFVSLSSVMHRRLFILYNSAKVLGWRCVLSFSILGSYTRAEGGAASILESLVIRV